MVHFAQSVLSRFLEISHTTYKRVPKNKKKSVIRGEIHSIVSKLPPEMKIVDVADQTSMKITNS